MNKSNIINYRSDPSAPCIQGSKITDASPTKTCRHWDLRAWGISNDYGDYPSTRRHASRCVPSRSTHSWQFPCDPTLEPILVLRALTLLIDDYNAAAYWSIIETNVGMLSACLPTLRPLYEGYRIDTIVSRLSSLGSGSRSATTCRDDIRLNSLEQGFPNRFSKVPRGGAGDPFPIDDDSNSSLQRP